MTEGDPNNTSGPFREAVKTFVGSMEAVVELSAFADEHASHLDDRPAAMLRIIETRLPNFQADKHHEAASIIEEMFTRIAQRRNEFADQENDEEKSKEINSILSDMLRRVSDLTSDSQAVYDYLYAYAESFTRPARVPMLRSSLITTAVGNFEVLVSRMVREFLRLKPGALRSD
jgi:hypothetical protein